MPGRACPGCLWEKKDGGGPFLSHAMDQSTVWVTQWAGSSQAVLAGQLLCSDTLKSAC